MKEWLVKFLDFDVRGPRIAVGKDRAEALAYCKHVGYKGFLLEEKQG